MAISNEKAPHDGGARLVEIELVDPQMGPMLAHIPFHKRLRDMRDAAIRRPKFRAIYAHALTVAHMEGHLIADDHPAWARIDEALTAARAGDMSALDTIERELLRMRGDKVQRET